MQTSPHPDHAIKIAHPWPELEPGEVSEAPGVQNLKRCSPLGLCKHQRPFCTLRASFASPCSWLFTGTPPLYLCAWALHSCSSFLLHMCTCLLIASLPLGCQLHEGGNFSRLLLYPQPQMVLIHNRPSINVFEGLPEGMCDFGQASQPPYRMGTIIVHTSQSCSEV